MTRTEVEAASNLCNPISRYRHLLACIRIIEPTKCLLDVTSERFLLNVPFLSRRPDIGPPDEVQV